MAKKKARFDFENTFYHVFNRGVNKQPIFLDDEDRWFFLTVTKNGLEKYDIETHSMCLMGNHYHYIFYTHKANLSLMMHHIGISFSKYFLTKYKDYKKDGRTFRGPYQKIIVDTNEYASNLLYYIHNNPVKDGFVSHPGDYKFSSYNFYEANSHRDNFGFLKKDLLLKKFIKVPRQALSDEFKEYSDWCPEDHVMGSYFLSNHDFAKRKLMENFTNEEIDRLSLKLKKIAKGVSSKDLLNYIDSLTLENGLKSLLIVFSLTTWSELDQKEISLILSTNPVQISRIKKLAEKRVNEKDLLLLKALKSLCDMFHLDLPLSIEG